MVNSNFNYTTLADHYDQLLRYKKIPMQDYLEYPRCILEDVFDISTGSSDVVCSSINCDSSFITNIGTFITPSDKSANLQEIDKIKTVPFRVMTGNDGLPRYGILYVDTMPKDIISENPSDEVKIRSIFTVCNAYRYIYIIHNCMHINEYDNFISNTISLLPLYALLRYSIILDANIKMVKNMLIAITNDYNIKCNYKGNNSKCISDDPDDRINASLDLVKTIIDERDFRKIGTVMHSVAAYLDKAKATLFTKI